MDKEQEYKEAVRRFYEVYGELKKHMELRMSSHFSLVDENWIEIWHYNGEIRGKILLRVKTEKGEQNADIECYKRATELAEYELRERRRKGDAHGRIYADHSG